VYSFAKSTPHQLGQGAQENWQSLPTDMQTYPAKVKRASAVMASAPSLPRRRTGLKHDMRAAAPSSNHRKKFCAAYEHSLCLPGGYSTAPFGPGMHSVGNVLRRVVKAVVAAKVTEVAPWNISAAGGRSPHKRDIQLPKITRLTETRIRQLMRKLETSLAMKSIGFPVGSSLPSRVTLKIEGRTQADMRMRL
jgi:hypothetical protein